MIELVEIGEVEGTVAATTTKAPAKAKGKRKKRRRTKGFGTLWQRGPWWWVQWRENGKRKHAKFPSRESAEQGLAKKLSDVALGIVGIEATKEPSPPLATLFTAWIKRRENSHRSFGDDASRWKTHCLARFGKLRPDELDTVKIRDAVEAMLTKKISPSTCHRVIALLSTFYTDLCERGIAKNNPAKGLPLATRRLMKSAHDPKQTPFVEKLEDVERIYRALPEPVNLAYALGSMAGLRVGETLALDWRNVDLEHRRIMVSEQVQDGKVVRPKDLDTRIVPIMDGLLPVLQAAKLASGGTGLLVRPLRDRGRNHLGPHTLGKAFKAALAKLAKTGRPIPAMTWYQATRHTFASQWVLAGGTIEKLREVMGHSTVLVTERYAHLRGDIYSAADLGRVVVDFARQEAKVVALRQSPAIGHTLATGSEAEQVAG